jgi:hypothetical protein
MPAISQDVRRDMLDREVAAAGPEAQKLYDEILAKGETAEWAAMCALQAAPRTKNTDRTFCDGHRRKMDKMDPVNQKHILRIAKEAGINTQGKFFNGIGRYNDPDSWSSSQQDVIDAAKRKRLKLEGPVNCDYIREDLPPPKPKPLAEDIVKNEALGMLKQDGRLREKMRKSPTKTRREMREQIRAKHSRG